MGHLASQAHALNNARRHGRAAQAANNEAMQTTKEAMEDHGVIKADVLMEWSKLLRTKRVDSVDKIKEECQDADLRIANYVKPAVNRRPSYRWWNS